MTAIDISKKICEVLENKKAIDVKTISIKDLSALGDYLIVASGTSGTHVNALAEEVEYQLKKDKILPNGKEGQESNTWILLDYGDVIVNIFSEETRKTYNIEELWNKISNNRA